MVSSESSSDSNMPRPVVVEEALITSKHEGLQRTTDFETGLLFAQVSQKVDTLLHFAPTPEEDDGFTFSSGQVDAKWMMRHAELVARMLPGGISVIGCYAFAPGATLTRLEATLHPVVTFLAKCTQGICPETKQALVLLLPSDAKRVSAKAMSVGGYGAVGNRLSPLELKLVPSPPQVRLRPARRTIAARRPRAYIPTVATLVRSACS